VTSKVTYVLEVWEDVCDLAQDVDGRLAVGVHGVTLVQQRGVAGFTRAVGVQCHTHQLVLLGRDGGGQCARAAQLAQEGLSVSNTRCKSRLSSKKGVLKSSGGGMTNTCIELVKIHECIKQVKIHRC
jgi:hypothetical protein